MASRLLARLDAAIAKARNPVEVACHKAERAGFLARQGHLGRARKIIGELQAQFEWRPHAAVSAWVSLAEGLLDHYSALGGKARDRMLRAHVLSGSKELAPLHALAAAWLAHMEYVASDMTRMAVHAREALDTAAADNHSARSRACLVVAEAYHFAGHLDKALPWYAKSRQHALADGDEAHLSALMHNQAWLRGSQARLAALFEQAGAQEQLRQALMGAESTGHFDLGVGTASLSSLVWMLRAQMLAAVGRCPEALLLLEKHLERAMDEGLERLKAGFLADMAWCRLQAGDRKGASRDAQAALVALSIPGDVDDRAMAQARLAQVLAALEQPERAKQLADDARRDLNAHRAEQQRLAALLGETFGND